MNEIIQQIEREYRIADDGSVTLSIRGVARLAGVTDPALIGQFSTAPKGGAKQKRSKLIEILAEHGFEGAKLAEFSTVGIPDVAAALIVEYYAYECQPRYRSQQAKQCCRAFMAIGIRTWIQREAGWSQEPVPATEPQLEVTMPTEAEIDYLRSRDWEKAELAAIDAGEKPDYDAIRQDFGDKSGFTRAQQAVRTHKRQLKSWKQNQKRLPGSGD